MLNASWLFIYYNKNIFLSNSRVCYTYLAISGKLAFGKSVVNCTSYLRKQYEDIYKTLIIELNSQHYQSYGATCSDMIERIYSSNLVNTESKCI